MRAIAARSPFSPAEMGASRGKLQVAMVSLSPGAGVREEVLSMASVQDRLAFGERELYWLPSGGVSQSELDLRRIEKLLGSWTMRTKATVEQLCARCIGD